MLNDGRVVLSGFMCLFYSMVIVMAFTNSADARIVPLLTGVPGLVLSGLQFKDDIYSASTVPHQTEVIWPDKRAISLIGWFFILVFTTVILGCIIASACFTAAFLRLNENIRLVKAVSVAVLFNTLIYLIFELILKIPLYPGLMNLITGT